MLPPGARKSRNQQSSTSAMATRWYRPVTATCALGGTSETDPDCPLGWVREELGYRTFERA